MQTVWQDVRYGLRLLAGNPGFAAVVVLILAVGIGANTAVFSVINAVMLRPLPYTDAHRLVMLMEQHEKTDTVTVYDRFLRWREQNQVFEHMAAYSGRRTYVTGIDRPRYVRVMAVSSDLFPLLGVGPLLGRGFLPAEEQPGNDGVVVLSHAFWRDEFGASPEVIGRTVTLDGRSCSVVGVMPAHFQFPPGDARAFWVPLVYERTRDWPLGGFVFGLARLKKECTLVQAQAGMAVIADRLKQTDPEAGAITVQRLLDRKLGANRQLLWLLLGAAGFVLLIACTNVASLLLLKGRTFTAEDMQGTTQSAVIDENLAHQHFADVNPVGQRIHTKDMDYTIEGVDVDYTIVGVVGTLRNFRHLDPALGTLYHPQKDYWRDMVLMVRTQGDPLRLAGAIRALAAEFEKDDVITDVQTLEANLADLLAPRRFSMVLLGLFAGIALTLAAVGIYGLLQYSTAQQTHDIGIRMALGARRGDVLRAVLGHGLRLTLIGVVIGLVGAYALTRLLASLLYGVPPTDLLTFIGVSLVLVAIALLASYVPARRAARVDPMVALRYE